MRVFLTTAIAATSLFFTVTVATAQPHDWRSGVAETPNVAVAFEEPYEIANARQLPLHFSVMIPMGDGIVQTQTRGMPEGNIFEARFLTPDGALLEYLTISAGTVQGDTPAQHQQGIYDVIVQHVYPSIGFSADAEVLGGREAEFAGQPAVEFMAISTDPTYDIIVARIVGVVAPNGTDVVFFVQQSVRDTLGLGGPNEMSLTYAGGVADSIAFIADRTEAGDLVPF